MLKTAAHPYQPGASIYDFYASYHYWNQEGGSAQGDDSIPIDLLRRGALLGPGSLPQRRALLIDIEAQMRTLLGDDSFTMPYWDWSNAGSCDNDMVFRWFSGDGDNAVPADCRQPELPSGLNGCNCTISRDPFSGWKLAGPWGTLLEAHISRTFGCSSLAPSLPTQDVVSYYVQIGRYHADIDDTETEAFWRALSGQKYALGTHSWPISFQRDNDHDGIMRVQQWIAGTHVTSSVASDPMFYLELAFSDLLFERWMRQMDVNTHEELLAEFPTAGNAAGTNRDECMYGLFPLRKNSDYFTRSSVFGYTYDFFQEDIDLSGPANIDPIMYTESPSSSRRPVAAGRR